MCTDNFILLPPTPSPFLFFTWLFLFPVLLPASQSLTICLHTALSLLALGSRVGGNCLKAMLELYSKRCLCPRETLKIWGHDTENACMCAFEWQVWESSMGISVFMEHCQALQHSDCVNHWHTYALTMSHQHTWSPPPPVFSFFSILSVYAYRSVTLSNTSVIAATQGKTAAVRPCDEPQCRPDVYSALSQWGKASLWRPWKQTDYAIPSTPSPSFTLATLSIGSWQEPTFPIFTLPQFFCSF